MTQADNLDFKPRPASAMSFFERQPDYAASPLKELSSPSGATVLAKDETSRMGLGAFKALGGPYAVFQILAACWKKETGQAPSLPLLNDAAFRAFAARQTFVAASAGNHGIGVAAGAKAHGANARIHLASCVSAGFEKRLRSYGAQVVRSGEIYEDAVAAAIADAERSGATLLADSTWPGYTEIPKLVMEGYTVIAEELRQEFEKRNTWPTHVFLQGGVGGLAAAMAHMIRLNWTEQPEVIVVEPDAAPCLKASHQAGMPVRVDGPISNMGRLDCKAPSIVSWHTLERCGVTYSTLSEEDAAAAAKAVTSLGIPTTPSGAAGYGAALKQINAGDYGVMLSPLIIVTEAPTLMTEDHRNEISSH